MLHVLAMLSANSRAAAPLLPVRGGEYNAREVFFGESNKQMRMENNIKALEESH